MSILDDATPHRPNMLVIESEDDDGWTMRYVMPITSDKPIESIVRAIPWPSVCQPVLDVNGDERCSQCGALLVRPIGTDVGIVERFCPCCMRQVMQP